LPAKHLWNREIGSTKKTAKAIHLQKKIQQHDRHLKYKKTAYAPSKYAMNLSQTLAFSVQM